MRRPSLVSRFPRLVSALTLAPALGMAATGRAQPPGGPPPAPALGPGSFGPGPFGPGADGPGPRARGAEFLLAHTGELQLTDQQVVRLAAVARRAAARRQAFAAARRAAVDSAFAAGAPGPRLAPNDGARRGGPPRVLPRPGAAQAAREQERADLRDALAVLTVDQQASAWLLVGAGPGRDRPAGGAPGGDRGMGSGIRPRGAGPGRPGDGRPAGGPPPGGPEDAP